MDDLTKLRIRKRARIAHLFAQGLSVVAIILTVMNGFVSSHLGQLFSAQQIENARQGLISAFWNYSDSRVYDLAAFIPPTDPAARPAWAAQIQAHLEQPVAVFLKNGAAWEWFQTSERFSDAIRVVPRLFETNPPDSLRGKTDTLGAMEFRRHHLVPKHSLDENAWIAGPLNDSLRWGIVFSKWDTWNAFFAGLERAKLRPHLEPAADAMKHVIDVGGSGDDNNPYPKLRVISGEREIFRSHRLDTMFQSDLTRLGTLKMELYLSRHDQAIANVLQHRAVPVGQQLLVIAAVMVLLFVFWRWIVRLTQPGA